MRLLAACVALVVGQAGCSFYTSSGDDDTSSCEYVPEVVDPEGAHYQFVVDSVILPDSATRANAFGVNLDGDELGRPDNAIGQILSTIASQSDSVDLNGDTSDKIANGDILHLIDVQAVSLDDALGVGVVVRHGIDSDGDPTDNFDGDEPFGIDAALGTGELSGFIFDGDIDVKLGTLPVAVAFAGLDEPYVIHLQAARIVATIDAGGMEGRLAGVVPQEEFDTSLFPAFHAGLSSIIADDCPDGVCDPGSFGEDLLDLFDKNEDGVMSYEELTESALTKSLTTPDVDMFAEGSDCIIEPLTDGVKDSLSVGLWFTAVPAVF